MQAQSDADTLTSGDHVVGGVIWKRSAVQALRNDACRRACRRQRALLTPPRTTTSPAPTADPRRASRVYLRALRGQEQKAKENVQRTWKKSARSYKSARNNLEAVDGRWACQRVC